MEQGFSPEKMKGFRYTKCPEFMSAVAFGLLYARNWQLRVSDATPTTAAEQCGLCSCALTPGVVPVMEGRGRYTESIGSKTAGASSGDVLVYMERAEINGKQPLFDAVSASERPLASFRALRQLAAFLPLQSYTS